jgi:hypothetical protein
MLSYRRSRRTLVCGALGLRRKHKRCGQEGWRRLLVFERESSVWPLLRAYSEYRNQKSTHALSTSNSNLTPYAVRKENCTIPGTKTTIDPSNLDHASNSDHNKKVACLDIGYPGCKFIVKYFLSYNQNPCLFVLILPSVFDRFAKRELLAYNTITRKLSRTRMRRYIRRRRTESSAFKPMR